MVGDARTLMHLITMRLIYPPVRFCHDLHIVSSGGHSSESRTYVSKLAAWWRHDMQTLPHHWPFVRGIHRSSHKGPVIRSFDVFFGFILNELLNKHLSCLWFETPWHPGHWMAQQTFSVTAFNAIQSGPFRNHSSQRSISKSNATTIRCAWRIRNALQWRLHEPDGVSNHRRLDCLINRLFRRRDERKHQSSASLAFVRGIHRWSVNSPRKRPVTRKIFRFDDVIMVGWRPLLELVSWYPDMSLQLIWRSDPHTSMG